MAGKMDAFKRFQTNNMQAGSEASQPGHVTIQRVNSQFENSPKLQVIIETLL
jgi:hypothetical protein